MRLFLPLIAVLIVSACGKTGNLYLPGEDAAVEEPIEQTASPSEQ